MFLPTVVHNTNWRYLARRNGGRGLLRSLSARAPTIDAESAPPPQQAFVKTRLEPGEWDLDRKNPLYRPKYRSSARLIATDDFANRPTVGMNAEFESLQDAMVTLSWLDQNEQKIIYRLYLDLMVSAEASSGGKTSHEYVMRVIAQKFNLTAQRVAAVVQLQHNEQQMILENPDIELCDDLADEMDQLIKQEISDAYQTFNLKKPESFVEDPVNDIKDGKKWVIANDVFDVDQMAEDAIVREEREARLIIDGHVYVEDMDSETIPVPLDKDCKYLLKQKDVIQKKLSEQDTTVHTERAKKTALEPKWRTKNGEGVTRERYKFVAQTVNTRQLKKARAKSRSYSNNNPVNTLVEHDGTLRAANMSDMQVVPWKATRNNMEHCYSDAKKGWLDRVNRNMSKSWGNAPVRAPRLKPLPPPPDIVPPPPSTDDIPPVGGSSAVAAEMKSSEAENTDVSPVKETEPEIVAPLAEAVVEASAPASMDTTVASSDSKLIEEMNATAASLEVSPPADVSVGPALDEPVVVAEVSAQTVDAVSEDQPIAAVEGSADAGDVTVTAPYDAISTEIEAKTEELSLNTSSELPNDGTSTTTDTLAGDEMNATEAAQGTNDTTTSSSDDVVIVEEMKANEISQETSPSSDTAIIDKMNAVEASFVDTSIDHQMQSMVEESVTRSTTGTPTVDNVVSEEMNTLDTFSTEASPDDSVPEDTSAEMNVESDRTAATSEVLLGVEPISEVDSSEREVVKAADMTIEPFINEDSGVGDGSDESTTAAISSEAGNASASSMEPHAVVNDVANTTEISETSDMTVFTEPVDLSPAPIEEVTSPVKNPSENGNSAVTEVDSQNAEGPEKKA